MTLHHILDIFIRLSHNDGINEPDALYLTLSSKISAHSELASLDSAANEGKGMSQVHAWDLDYDDGGNEDVTEHQAAQSMEDSRTADLQTKTVHHADQVSREHAPSSADVKETAAEAGVEAHEDHVSRDQEIDTGLAEIEHQQQENARVDDTHEAEENHSYHEEQLDEHDASEAPNTESSVTTTSMPQPTEQPEDPTLGVDEGDWEHPKEEYQADDDPSGQDYDHQNSAEQEADEYPQDQDPEEFQDEVSQEETEAPGAVVDTDAIDLTSVHEAEPTDEPDTGTEAQEEVAGPYEDHDSLGESESTVDNAPPEESNENIEFDEHDLGSEDDLLGIAEDVLQTPTKDGQGDQAENSEDDLTTPPVEKVDTRDPHADEGEDDDIYADFETSETIQLGETDPSLADSQPQDNLSAKRSRDEEDDWDFVDTNPDLKRRRPS